MAHWRLASTPMCHVATFSFSFSNFFFSGKKKVPRGTLASTPICHMALFFFEKKSATWHIGVDANVPHGTLERIKINKKS